MEQYPGYDDPKPIDLPEFNNFGTFSPYNFVEEFAAKGIKLPIIDGMDPNDYTYKIIIGTAEFILSQSPDADGKYYTFDIPMKNTKGMSGNNEIKVQAIAINDEYSDSKISNPIGYINFRDPSNLWIFTNATWQARFNSWSWTGTDGKTTNNEINHETKYYDYLTFYAPPNASNRRIKGDTNGVTFQNGGVSLDFTIYKDCELTIKGTSTGAQLSVGGGNPASITLSQNPGGKTVIELGDYDFINVSLSGQYNSITSITTTPYK